MTRQEARLPVTRGSGERRDPLLREVRDGGERQVTAGAKLSAVRMLQRLVGMAAHAPLGQRAGNRHPGGGSRRVVTGRARYGVAVVREPRKVRPVYETEVGGYRTRPDPRHVRCACSVVAGGATFPRRVDEIDLSRLDTRVTPLARGKETLVPLVGKCLLRGRWGGEAQTRCDRHEGPEHQVWGRPTPRPAHMDVDVAIPYRAHGPPPLSERPGSGPTVHSKRRLPRSWLQLMSGESDGT